MKIKRLAVIAIFGTLLATPSFAASVPDEQFDSFGLLTQKYSGSSGAKYIGAVFTDSGYRAIETPSYLNIEDAPVGTPFCTSMMECKNHSISMVANLGFCHTATEMNCIETVLAIDPSGKKIPFVNQKYFPADQETVFKSNASQVPNGSTTSVVQFPGVLNSAGTNDYAVGVAVNQRFTTDSNGNLSTFYDPNFIASISPVQLVKGMYKPRVAEKISQQGINGEALSRHSECVVLEVGVCGLPVSFPEGYSFSLFLRLNLSLYGWLHGRLTDGIASSSYLGNVNGLNYLVAISGKPSAVPEAVAAVPFEQVSADFIDKALYKGFDVKGFKPEDFPFLMTYAPVRGTYTYNGFLTWSPYLNQTAVAMPKVWSVRAIQKDQMGDVSADSPILRCIAGAAFSGKNGGIVGFLNTNATSYLSGPPTYNPSDQSLDYKVAAPHYAKDGSEFQGIYTLQIRQDVAKCIFGLTDAPVKATVSVTSLDGQQQAVTTSMSERDGFYYFQASGFHFSAPTIKLKLVNTAVPAKTPTTVSALRAIKCVKGKLIKKVVAVNPKCPSGYHLAS